MSNSAIAPVFVRSILQYPAYDDFWRVVGLSGFQVRPAPLVDLAQPGTYIWPTMDMEFIERMSNEPPGARRARVIFWNLERPDEKPVKNLVEFFRKAMSEILAWADAIWISELSLHVADPRTVFAVFGGHPGLRLAPPAEPRFDVAHMGQRTPRREALIAGLEKAGIRVSPNAWGDEREAIFASSRLFLNIDRVEAFHLSSPIRWAMAAAYGLPLVTEAVIDPYPLVDGKSILSAPYASLEYLVVKALAARDLAREVGEQGRRVFCEEWPFRRGVEEALRRTPCLTSS